MGKIIIYTDGGSRGNPGLGAWAYCIMSEFGLISHKDSSAENNTTNNQMELKAIHNALKVASTQYKSHEIEIRTDSQYCIGTLTTWAYSWISCGTLDTHANWELIRDILTIIDDISKSDGKVTFIKVKGHSGESGNEFVDKLLNCAMDNYIEKEDKSKPIPASDNLEDALKAKVDKELKDPVFGKLINTFAAYAFAKQISNWQKEQMMKDAIEGEVIDKGDFIKFADGKYIDLNPTMGAEPFVKLEEGDKVKVIIIKE